MTSGERMVFAVAFEQALQRRREAEGTDKPSKRGLAAALNLAARHVELLRAAAELNTLSSDARAMLTDMLGVRT